MIKRPKAVIFTRTNWSEPPRLRHQVADLLVAIGYDVIFFEQPSLKYWFKIHKENHITFIRHFELIHHRIRLLKITIWINAMIVKFFIKKGIKKLDLENAHVINFNYDYFFLNKLFKKGFVTIINDDFINKIKNPSLRQNTEYQLRKTCKESIINLAVSYPLQNQLNQFSENVALFFPWAERKYSPPAGGNKREVALFYGYINYRLDWPVLLGIINKGIKVRLIGPIEKSVNEQYVEQIRSYPNVEILPPTNITEVNFSDVCCSILPWDTSFEGIKAITINNKCFNLLSYGIPLVYADLPYLIESDNHVIAKCNSADDFVSSINFFSNNFEACQQPIQNFLKDHYADKRSTQLEKYLTQ